MPVERKSCRWTLGICFILIGLSTAGLTQTADAQSLDLQQLLDFGNSRVGRATGPVSRTSTIDSLRDQTGSEDLMQGQAMLPQKEEKPSALERDYRSRMLVADEEKLEKAKEERRQDRMEKLKILGDVSQVDDLMEETRDDTREDPRLALRQFGYDIFSRQVTPTQLTVGRAPSDYVLGVGDQLVVSLHGSTEADYVITVDREGRLLVPSLAPINAAGRTFEEVRDELRQQTEASLLGTTAYVSLGAVRVISVYVLGEVEHPGVQRVTSLSSVVEALSIAGGVKKSGTLRDIRVVRGGDVQKVDIYKVLTGTPGADLTLRDGDQIIVPPIGETFAVTGEVNRAAIYELAPGQTSIAVDQALGRAGGTLRPRGYGFMLNHIEESGLQAMLQVERRGGTVHSGDILHVSLVRDMRVGSIRVLGHINVPGYVSLQSAPKLSDVIHDINQLERDPYLPFAVVETTDPATQARIFKAVSLEGAIKGTSDYEFKSSDWLYVLGMDDVKFLSSALVQQVIVQGRVPERQTEETASGDAQQLAAQASSGDLAALQRQQSDLLRQNLQQQAATGNFSSCRGLNRLAQIVSDTRSDRFANAVANIASDPFQNGQTSLTCPDIFDINEELMAFVLEHVVAVHGAVRRPGVYPVTDTTDLASIINVAGGVVDTADMSSVEILQYAVSQAEGTSSITRHEINLLQTNAASVTVSPGSALRFNQVLNQRELGGILLTGEFVRPGFYALRRGETLSQVIERAGGLTNQAYPYGAVFTRESAKEAQRAGFRRAARELNSALTLAAVQENANAQGLATIQATARELETVEAAGRVVIEADPTVLRVRPNLDVVLQPGDELHMPKRPSSVTVVGDVLNPGTLQFVAGKTVDAYLREAGGYQRTADKGRVFIVYPNGEAEPYSTGFAGMGGSQPLPPGTSIVVPRDLLPFNWRRFAVDMTQILSQLAISAVALGSIN